MQFLLSTFFSLSPYFIVKAVFLLLSTYLTIQMSNIHLVFLILLMIRLRGQLKYSVFYSPVNYAFTFVAVP